jgi:hypothetical protein
MLQFMLRQLAGGIARQTLDDDQGTRQKYGIDPLAQMVGEGGNA